jgi:hypothetical protein
MRSYLRALLAAITGALVTIILAYVSAIVLLIVRIGVPLGSEGREPTGGEYLGLLLICGGAAAIGAHFAAGIARDQQRAVVIMLAIFLAGGAVWGFTRPASQWPLWWGPTLGAVAAVSTWLGGTGLKGRFSRTKLSDDSA